MASGSEKQGVVYVALTFDQETAELMHSVLVGSGWAALTCEK
jgi:hypothetical protein